MNALDNIRIVLVEPLYGGNVGSVCRAMSNMGCGDLALVTPRPLDGKELRQMACGAWDVYERHTEWDSLPSAVADCGLVMGSTARLGLYRSHATTPREVAPRILQAAQTAKVALVFGREDNGLSNEELAACTQIIQIPSSSAYSSLNLSHAVIVCLYEVFACSGEFTPSQELSPEAPSKFRERMFAMWREALLEIGFMKPDKALHMMLGLRRVLSRGKLSVHDCRIMTGVARQMLWKARLQGASGQTPPAEPEQPGAGPSRRSTRRSRKSS